MYIRRDEINKILGELSGKEKYRFVDLRLIAEVVQDTIELLETISEEDTVGASAGD